MRGSLAHEVTRRSFLQDKAAVYEELIQLHLAQGGEAALWQAFEVSEAAKSRTLADLLSGVLAAGSGSEDPEMAHLAADLSAAYNRFFTETIADPEQRRALQARTAHLEKEISRLRLRHASRADAGEGFGVPLPFAELRAALAEEPPLVCYHLVGDEILAFVVSGARIRVIRGIGRVAVVQRLLQRLTTQWDRFRAGADFAGRNLLTLERSARRVLADLYEETFAAVERAWEGDRPPHLTVIAHGILHQLPFHALHDGEAYLVERIQFSYAPSAAVHLLSIRREVKPGQRSVVMGFADELIPAAEVEARAVAGELSASGGMVDLRLGADATIAGLRDAASGGVVHLVCHGLFRADNPIYSALRFADGWLTAAEAIDLDLDGALVTLSACESGRSRVQQGEEVIGFPRALLGAGAAGVAVSLWLVQDETTAALMADWYREMRMGAERGAALRTAQLRARAANDHPYYWAPFILIGQ
jgi:CHAT domain-containing protein